MCNNFKKKIAWFRGLAPKSRPFLIYQPTAINQKPVIMSFRFFFIKLCTEMLKTNKHQLKTSRLHYVFISSKSCKSLELFFSFHNNGKNKLEMLVTNCSNNWRKFILMPMILKKKQWNWLLIWNNAYDDITDFEISGYVESTKI